MRYAEIDQHRRAIFTQHHVFGLEITVDDARLVQRRQRMADERERAGNRRLTLDLLFADGGAQR